MPLTEARKRANEKYRKSHVRQFLLRFYPADAGLWDWLQRQPQKQEYLRQLIREDMEWRTGNEAATDQSSDIRSDLTRDRVANGRICRESIDGESCRYILGAPSKDGDNIIVIGANPSRASIDVSDPMMDNITRTVEVLGAKGYVVLNLYPWRSGSPDGLPDEADEAVLAANVQAFEDVLAMPGMETADVWAAWGGLIEKRAYLAESLRQIVGVFKRSGYKGSWFQMGEGTANGHHPRHPNPRIKTRVENGDLLPWNMERHSFDVESYLTEQLP